MKDNSFRVHFVDSTNETQISPWHDIKLFYYTDNEQIVNFVNEIPRGSTAKMEIATEEINNPIKQDIKKGKLRHYNFESLVNYGCLPQTYEDPEHIDVMTGFKGDGDPLDVCEIGSKVATTGETYPVKVLGVLGMIDEGEMDWKIIAIRLDDPMADFLHDIRDVKEMCPGKIESLIKWFKHYKVPDGKPVNQFAFEEQAMDQEFAVRIIKETHQQWKRNYGYL